MSLMLSGTGVSRGIARGQVRLLHEIQQRVTASHIKVDQVEEEMARLGQAMHEAIEELRAMQARLQDKVPDEIMSFFDSHLLMLEDKTLSQPVMELVRDQHYTSEWALAVHRDALMKLFARIEDPYLHQRAEDVENVIAKVLRKLVGEREPAVAGGEEYVVVTRNIAPADVMAHQQDGMRALICTQGGTMSHAAIVARGLRVPTVVAVHPALRLLRDVDEVIVDGDKGMVVASPDKRSIKHYRGLISRERKRQKQLRLLADRPTVTEDGTRIELLANVDSPAEASQARRAGAAGIGLFRTEVLYLNRNDLPDEREQLATYRKLLRSMKGQPVTVRTMDLWAGGKAFGLPGHLNTPQSPALGQRGIRLCLAHPELFEPQIRAMLRASASGPIRILLPMITTLDELRDVLALIDRVHGELREQRYNIPERAPVGLLVEVPAVALSLPMFIPHVDFLAIGSNDLAQYTLAVDRDDDDVQQLYDPLHPAVLYLLREVFTVGRKHAKAVVMCGELASDARVCRLLLGLGMRHLSVHPAALLEVRNAILQTDVSAISKLARRALKSENTAQTQRLIDKLQ